MNRLRLALLASGLIMPLAVGLIASNAVASDHSEIGGRGKIFTDADVRGSYAFSFQGTIIGVGPAAAAGVVIADGRGNITSGVRTLNVNGFAIRQTFTCSYSVNPDGTGSAV